MKNYNLNLDFTKSIAYKKMAFVEDDYGASTITFISAQTLTGLILQVAFKFADDTYAILRSDDAKPYIEIIDANTAVLSLPTGVLDVVGRVECQVALYNGTESRLTTAVCFYYTVVDDLSTDAAVASDNYPILTQLIIDCEAIEAAEELRVIAEGAADPRSGRVGAELDRVDAEAARAVYEAYDAGKDYVASNKVYHNGSSYIALQPSKGKTPSTEPTYWMVIASKGDQGIQGEPGPQGIPGGNVTTASELPYDNAESGLAAENTQAAIDEVSDLISSNTTDISTINFNILSYMDDFLPIGASWDKGETPTLSRTDLAIGKTADIGIDGASATNDFDSMPIYRDIYTITDSLGNEFVRIPKFYIRKTDGVGSKTWQVSKYKHTGFYLPWCFWDFTNSRELPYVDYGCYDGSLDGAVLASKAGTYPLINKTIVDFRGYAQANNAGGLLGYQQLDIHVIDVLRALYFIEFGTLNSQAIMRGFTEGQYASTHLATATENAANRIVVANATADLYRVGQAISVGTTQGGNQKFYGRTITGITVVDGSNKAVEFDGDPVDIATGNYLYNTGWKSGFSANIAASSGVITANDGKYPCSYRGIENPFGSIWQFVDGVNIIDNQAWVAKNAEQYASNLFASPYEALSYVNHTANGYGPTSMGYDSNLPFAEFATGIGGDTSKYYSDYYYQGASSRIASFGGSWSDRLSAGLSYWSLGTNSSYAYVYVGGRLLKKPL